MVSLGVFSPSDSFSPFSLFAYLNKDCNTKHAIITFLAPIGFV